MEITLKDLFNTFKRFIILILAMTILFGVAAACYAYVFNDTTYRSQAKFSCKNSSTAIDGLKEEVIGDEILDQVIVEISTAYPEIDKKLLSSMISVEKVDETKYALLVITHKDSGTAYYVCNVLTEIVKNSLTDYVTELITKPTINNISSNSNFKKTIVIGAVAGFAISLVVVFIIASVNRKVYLRSDVERYFSVDVMGAVPKKNKQTALQVLRLNALYKAFNFNQKKLAITSVGIKRENCLFVRVLKALFGINDKKKDTVGKELAIYLAESGKKTIYIDALNNGGEGYGLNDYLIDRMGSNPVVPTENRNLFVINGGAKVQDQTELISSKKMNTLLNSLSKQCDCIILDLPPVNKNTTPLAVHNMVDGYALSVQAGVSTVSQVTNALGSLNQLSSKIHGIILEDAKKKDVLGGRNI